VVRFLQAEGVSESEIHHRCVFTARTFSTERKFLLWYKRFKDGRTALNDVPQKHRGRSGTSHTDENCHCRRFGKERSKIQNLNSVALVRK
jgi:hypothetical protein